MTKQKTEHEDTGQSMKTQHRDGANIPPPSYIVTNQFQNGLYLDQANGSQT